MTDLPAYLDESDGMVASQDTLKELTKYLNRNERLFKWFASRDKPNMIWEGNNGSINAQNQVDLLVYRIPVGMRLLVNRLMIMSDGLTPGAGKYTNAGAYWQLFDGASRNEMAMPDFGPLDGSQAGNSQIPMINVYGTKGLIFEQGEVHFFLNAPALPANKNVVVMFTGWLEPPFPDTQ